MVGCCIVTFSTLQYRTNRDYWQQWFPADLISESFPGQFRNWFYSLIAMSTVMAKHAPFRHIFHLRNPVWRRWETDAQILAKCNLVR